MKRFITKKTIKVERYKLLYLFTFIFIIVLIIINMGLNIFLKYSDSEELVINLSNNAYGNIFNDKKYKNKNNKFYQNIYGFPFKDEKPVNNNINLESFMSDPIIYIYNTFQTSKYVNPYYSSYSINPVITQASLILQEYLKNLEINAIVETASVAKVLKENNTSYTNTYKGSRILMEKAKNNNPSLKYFLDIDLSADKKDITTYNSDNVSYAKILFIVGTDYDSYGENQKFAISLNEKLEVINKNLSRGISLRGGAGYHGVYNQDFSNRTLRILIGGKENTIDEVNRSLKILAKVIADYIMEENYEKK